MEWTHNSTPTTRESQRHSSEHKKAGAEAEVLDVPFTYSFLKGKITSCFRGQDDGYFFWGEQ